MTPKYVDLRLTPAEFMFLFELASSSGMWTTEQEKLLDSIHQKMSAIKGRLDFAKERKE